MNIPLPIRAIVSSWHRNKKPSLGVCSAIFKQRSDLKSQTHHKDLSVTIPPLAIHRETIRHEYTPRCKSPDEIDSCLGFLIAELATNSDRLLGFLYVSIRLSNTRKNDDWIASVKTTFKNYCRRHYGKTVMRCFQLTMTPSRSTKKLSEKFRKRHFFTKNHQKNAFLLTI
jgi:hypothetical protein